MASSVGRSRTISFGRFKSPWRKRRRPCNDSGDVPEKCPEGSCEFLLKPKEVTRAASETCYHTPTSGGKSNSTVASSNLPCNTKCSGRSYSLSDVGHEKSSLKSGDTVPHAVQECSNCQDQAPTKLATVICACHQKQGRTKLPKSICVCSQEQPKNPCECPQEKVPFCKHVQEKVAEVVRVSSKKQDASDKAGPSCCLQEKMMEVPKKEQDTTNLPKKSQEQVPKVEELPPIEQKASNQPGPLCKCFHEKIMEVEQVPKKEQNATNLPKKPQDQVPKVEKVPSKEQKAPNQQGPLCEYLQEELVAVEQVPAKELDGTKQPKPLQGEVPQVGEVLSMDQQLCHRPAKQKPLPEKVPSKAQDPTNKLGLCCKCHLEKLPKIVQVPSHSRSLEESCQYPEENVVPVHEETQYESTPASPRSTKNLGQCGCRTYNQSQMLCIPVKVQSNKIASPEMCLTIAPAQMDAPKKQKAKPLNVSCQSGEGNKLKVDSQCKHQHGKSAYSKDTSQNHCHHVDQVFGPIPIRRQSYSTVAVNEETGEYSIVKEVTVVNKFTRSVTCASNDAAQTSDHSICFENDQRSCQYPLFFKIINADVTKNE